MAEHGGTAPNGLSAEHLSDLTEHDFFGALRRVECLFRDHPRLGEALHMSDEPVRLGQSPDLGFRGSPITDYAPAEEHQPAQLKVGFFGLWGPHGPLPLHVTEYAFQRARQAQDHTLSAFADIFHHRILTLLYRAWANAQPTASHDRPESDRFAAFVSALAGVDRHAEGALDRELDFLSMALANHFLGNTRHPEGLEKLLGEFLGVPARVEEFVGEWLDLPDAYCWQLGSERRVDPRLGQLGLGTRLGRQKWERQFKFRVVLGPMGRALYDKLLPDGSMLPQVMALVTRYAGRELCWDLRLILRTSDMTPIRLGVTGRLGTTTYLVREPSDGQRHWQDLTFNPLNAAAT